jgi:hypothetical protein
LSNPRLRVTDSSSQPISVTRIIGCFTSPTKAPTQGAKSPSIPMFMDCGINPLAKFLFYVCPGLKLRFLQRQLQNQLHLSLIPLFKTVSKLYPFLFIATFIPK